MRKGLLIFAVVASLFGGCVYEAPLIATRDLPIDPAVLGLWEEISEEKSDTPDRMAVLQLSETEYLINYPLGNDGMYFRGWRIEVDGVSCVQLELLGYAEKALPPGEPQYLVATCALGQDLEIKTLNTDLVGKNLKDSAALRKAFLEHKDAPDLFANPARFRKVVPQNSGG